MQPLTFTRAQLFERVWGEPMRRLAPQFGVSDVGLAKICREHSIPRPWRGYWQQLAAGKKLKRPALPPLPPGSPADLETIYLTPTEKTAPASEPVAVVAQRRFEADPEHSIVVPERLIRPHPLVAHTREVLKRAQPTHRYGDRGIVGVWNEVYLDVRVTKGSLDRALRIMDALIKAVEKRGYEVEVTKKDRPQTRVVIGDVKIPIRLDERTRRVEVESKGPQAWMYPRYEFHPTNELTIRIDSWLGQELQGSWGDGKRKRLEERLGEVVIGLVAAAEKELERRVERERREKEHRERERRREEEARRAERERARRAQLEQWASAWANSEQLRRFVSAARSYLEGEELLGENREAEEWLEWALAHANRTDPLTGGDLRAILRRVPPSS